jgi:hypothetical protein
MEDSNLNMEDSNKIKELEEVIKKQYQVILELSKVADEALSSLELNGYGVSAHPIRQKLNKLKP